MARFWVYVGDKVQGPVDIPSMRKLPGFNLLSQVCEEGGQNWRIADEVIEIKSYFISPPRPNSFAIDQGNTAPKLDLPVPQPDLEEMTLPEPNTAWQKKGDPLKTGEPVLEVLPAGNAGLRMLCEVCGYKNPRDVAVCMKCGENLKGSAAAASSAKITGADPLKGKETVPLSAALPTPSVPLPIPVATPAPTAAVDPNQNTMVEISMSKLLIGCAAAALIMGASFFGYRGWRKHHLPKRAAVAAVPAAPAKPISSSNRSGGKHYDHRKARAASNPDAAELPGVSRKAAEAAEPANEPASYRVVPEAAPLKKRFSSPINSPYAVKRRANTGLWTSQEDQSIQQVQRTRIYGGQRTIDRNVEILMQILRDREYNTAFESGKRIYLYNDVDWSAVLKEGPVYEVRLTFSGGRETDGSPKKPLHFAFASDLERGTVEPGGQDQVRSNTLHAFFDESRIAPEDRRAIAKDTEELVLAAQPGASPLALDTVVRQFAKVYTTAALARVADAYDLTLVKKRLAHDTRLGSNDPSFAPESKTQTFGSQVVQSATPPTKNADKPTAAQTGWAETPSKTQNESSSKVSAFAAPAKSGGAQFRMETGSGRERTFVVRAVSRAPVGKIWEVMTGYDRLKQFIPDMLVSEREGQDGAATIVHTVCLTRFMIFMFKVNLHLRIIEHPREHTMEFERIAGEFESFRGAVELSTDPATHESIILFHATVVPSSRMMNWTLESAARRLLVPQVEAIRAKAESI